MIKRRKVRTSHQFHSLLVAWILKNFHAIASFGELEARLSNLDLWEIIEPVFHGQMVEISGSNNEGQLEACSSLLNLLDFGDALVGQNAVHKQMFLPLGILDTKHKPTIVDEQEDMA
jgi:hypothetical protein